MKSVTYNESVKLLNGMCEGLGDLLESKRTESFRNSEKHYLSMYVMLNHCWGKQAKFWNDVFIMLTEIEDGKGIKK